MDLNELRESIVTEFTPHWALNDRAHRIEHFLAVERAGNLINDKLRLDHDPKLIMLVAFFHDLFAWTRFNHELLSYEYVSTTNHPIFMALDIPERQLVAEACREHRASYKGDYSHQFSLMMSSADRGEPGDIDGILQRSYHYHLDNLKLGVEEARKGCIAHMKHKSGTGGYAAYPHLYEQAFGDRLDKQRKAIDALEVDAIDWSKF